MVASRDNFPLIAELLAEQRRLDTPVARFSAAHEAGTPAALTFAPQLIPLTAPGLGEQYAFEVDLDSCTGCKSCVTACHSLNGLDETETWRDVGLLVSPSPAHPFTQTITSACHHCADPACLNGCPVLAYEKDPVTGIVRHLDDQCIGCSYCILKCPYDVPKFSERLGIVRKCDMCHGRLAEGEPPACAQACPTHAIRIVTVPSLAKSATATIDSLEEAFVSFPGTRPPFRTPFLPSAPDPTYTRPTTRYVTQRTFPTNLVAADGATLRPQPAHWSLVILLTLIPAAIGLTTAAAFLNNTAPRSIDCYATLFSGFSAERLDRVIYYLTVCEVGIGAVGLAASGLHLGRPLRAWRIFLGWRKSWLSREAMVLGAWFGTSVTALVWPELITLSAVIGLVGMTCSAMIYIDTHRRFWRASQTVPRFFGTAAACALAPFVPWLAAIILVGKMGCETRTWFDRSVSARLQRGPLRVGATVRDCLGLGAIIALLVTPGAGALIVLLASELSERYLFFRAVDAPKMPGSPT